VNEVHFYDLLTFAYKPNEIDEKMMFTA